MKAVYRVNPKLSIEVEGSNQKELFSALASATEVFGEKECGQCAGEVVFAKRNVDGNDFFEMACINPECRARLSIGQSKQRPGELFPIRKIITSGPEKGKPSRKKGEYDTEAQGYTKYRGQPVDED